MTTRRTLTSVLAAAMVLAPAPAMEMALSPASAAPAGSQTPAEAAAVATVTALHDRLIEVMKAGRDYEARVRALDPVVRKTFNLPAMARIAVGPYWQRMSEAEQARFVDVFARLSVAQYANRFDTYSGESFEVVSTEPGPRDSIVVRTRLLLPGESPVALNYVVQNLNDSGWRATDVFLDGSISELAIRRSEYTSVLRSQGADALIQALERKIVQLAQTS